MQLILELPFACFATFLFNSETMSIPAPDLPEEVLHRIQRCDGFLDLKMARRARAEWNQVPEGHRDHPLTQGLLMRLLVEEKDWGTARDLAARLHAQDPGEAGTWIQLAYTTRRVEHIAAAEAILTEARQRFPKESVIVYNLACYACQSGRLDEARELLHASAELDPKSLDLAAEDDDLRPLWPELPGP